MAENIQRSTGRTQEYKFDRGGMPAEMGPYIGIVVNNIDNTRSGRLQVWIEQFGATNTDGTPNLTDDTTWRTVRYISPFYGATKQSGTTGVGSYPGNRNSYGMWFTPPELGTKVLCFFVSGDPSVGGYYVGCIPEDGVNRMIPAIGAVSNYSPNNANQQQLLNGVTAAPVAEVNDIDPEFTDDPRFFDKPKPVQSTVESVLFQQGLNKDPIRGPIKSSAQRESPSNCYGISTPGKPIYQGGGTDKALKAALQQGKVKLQDIAIIGRQGGHTFVMDDGDIDGNDTLVRIRTAKGHQITMSDDGDAFFITHANGQTWIELGKQGTVDVYSTNSINLRSEGVLNFHADKGINMYSGGNFRIKSKKTMIVESDDKLLMTGENYALLTSSRSLGFRSDGTLALQGKMISARSDSQVNLSGKMINLNGGSALPVMAFPALQEFNLPDTEFVAGQGWVSKDAALQTVCNRAPTHEPYFGHNRGADVTTNMNPINVEIPDADSSVKKIYDQVNTLPVQNGLTLERLIAEPTAAANIGPLSIAQVTGLTAQTAAAKALKFPAFDADGLLNTGWQYDDLGTAIYNGLDLGSKERGIGIYGQSVEGLVATGFVKSSALKLINGGASPATVLNSDSVWSGQYGISGILDYLTSTPIQNIVQIGLATAAFAGLIDAGTVTENTDPRVVATLLQPATEYGVTNVVKWVDGFSTPAETVDIQIAARQGQYAIDFVDYYGQEIDLINVPPSVGTTERDVIDQAIADIIDNPKVPTPQYTDIPPEVINNTETVIQADGGLVKVDKPSTTNEDGTFRFSPHDNQG